MSATFAPFGMRPVYHPSGLDRASAYPNGIPYTAESLQDNVVVSQNFAFYKGMPVSAGGFGQIFPYGSIFPATYIGCFAGVEWTDATGRRRVANSWRPFESFVLGSVVVYAYDDGNIIYELQCNGPLEYSENYGGPRLTGAFNFADATSGNATTGLSTASLNPASPGQTGDFYVRYVAPYADNAIDDQYPIVRGTIFASKYQYGSQV